MIRPHVLIALVAWCLLGLDCVTTSGVSSAEDVPLPPAQLRLDRRRYTLDDHLVASLWIQHSRPEPVLWIQHSWPEPGEITRGGISPILETADGIPVACVLERAGAEIFRFPEPPVRLVAGTRYLIEIMGSIGDGPWLRVGGFECELRQFGTYHLRLTLGEFTSNAVRFDVTEQPQAPEPVRRGDPAWQLMEAMLLRARAVPFVRLEQTAQMTVERLGQPVWQWRGTDTRAFRYGRPTSAGSGAIGTRFSSVPVNTAPGPEVAEDVARTWLAAHRRYAERIRPGTPDVAEFSEDDPVELLGPALVGMRLARIVGFERDEIARRVWYDYLTGLVLKRERVDRVGDLSIRTVVVVDGMTFRPPRVVAHSPDGVDSPRWRSRLERTAAREGIVLLESTDATENLATNPGATVSRWVSLEFLARPSQVEQFLITASRELSDCVSEGPPSRDRPWTSTQHFVRQRFTCIPAHKAAPP